ncbi:rhamnogalacturonate lyase B [Pyrus ussuriensis x Pyrus communis]|uniref:rhamnogalacturonan endolyase n=1 Tax=Pyrus ussuriensis x Pyrus communis TaxID=2448454 RepID=A0A5N5HHJ4_9ROSA|nr:rhamnogalacturonate lyase B [Pyrus ussuriensis x Pyrus communis]
MVFILFSTICIHLHNGIYIFFSTICIYHLNNGLVRLTFSFPEGDVVGIQYKGIENLLEVKTKPQGGYWDLNAGNYGYYTPYGTKFKIVTATPDQIEISFTKTYEFPSVTYKMQRGLTGFYTYAIFERLEGWPQLHIDQIRIAFKLRQDKFNRRPWQGRQLAYKEAVLLTNPSNPEFRGEVDDKYQYSRENKDTKVHGWICIDQAVGFWIITPSDEFLTAGPFKQVLTSHVGPTALSEFHSGHYVGSEVGMSYAEGEPWKKVFGPVYVYLNSDVPGSNQSNMSLSLWNNAKEQMLQEVNIAGQLLIRDSYINEGVFGASSAYVGLAAPGDVGSWQRECKGCQFWTRADNQGNFLIKNVRPGNYRMYATVPGIIGDYKYEAIVTIEPTSEINLGSLTFEPPRIGPILWEIGIPDQSAAEFYIPDPYPSLANHLFNNSHTNKFRQYSLWDRYADLYPDHDLIYNVGNDNHCDDWFFAHVTRNIGNDMYTGTTWHILFQLQNVTNTGDYILQLALASANGAELQVRLNDQSPNGGHHFTTRLMGKDNAIARHGIHGLHRLFSVVVPSFRLREGNNTIHLTQSRSANGPFSGIMYDYIRLEGPPPK